MPINNRKKQAASSNASPISSQGTLTDGEIPSTSIDGDQLLLRLGALPWELHGQPEGVVERLCQEIVDSSQGHVQLVLLRYQYQPAHTPSYPEHSRLSLPVVHAGRTYGKLEIGPDPTRSDQPILSYQKAQIVAMSCAVLLYSLEAAAYFQREYPSPVNLPVNLTPREQEILELMCHGHQRKQIAPMLRIKPGTVAKICGTLYTQLGVTTEREAIAAAFRLGLFSSIEHLSANVNLSPARQEKT